MTSPRSHLAFYRSLANDPGGPGELWPWGGVRSRNLSPALELCTKHPCAVWMRRPTSRRNHAQGPVPKGELRTRAHTRGLLGGQAGNTAPCWAPAGAIQLRTSGEPSMSRRIVISAAAGAVVLAGAGAGYSGSGLRRRPAAGTDAQHGPLHSSRHQPCGLTELHHRRHRLLRRQECEGAGMAGRLVAGEEGTRHQGNDSRRSRPLHALGCTRGALQLPCHGLAHRCRHLSARQVAVLATAEDGHTTLDTKAAGFTV